MKERSRKRARLPTEKTGRRGASNQRCKPVGATSSTATASFPPQSAAAEACLKLLVQSDILTWTQAVELQRSCLSLCAVCRRCIPVRVRVVKKTPRSLWAEKSVGNSARTGAANEARDGARSGARMCRLPALRISSLVWDGPAKGLGNGGDLPAGLTTLTFGREFNRPLAGLAWPPKLERLTFGSKFNRDVSDVGGWGRGSTGSNSHKLPASLLDLTFGKHFNKPLPETGLPEGLVSLTLGRNFDRSLDKVVWPSGLKVVKLGEAMVLRFRGDPSGQLERIAWPTSLERVELDCDGAEVVWIPNRAKA